MNVLVLGATGMLGSTVFRILSQGSGVRVAGAVRSVDCGRFFDPELASRLVVADDLEDDESLAALLDTTRPQVVVNCVALRRPLPSDHMKVISVFSLLPHRLSSLCKARGARLIQISSDGVFSGSRGGYTEDDLPDARDVYGVAKLLGEVSAPHAITLRTSIIGHELHSRSGLLEWFLSQGDRCRCFTRAIFSGFPTVVLAQVIRDVIMPRPALHGVYHVATQPISKYDLLALIAEVYGKAIDLVRDDSVAVDRSLNADRFASATGYVAPPWPEMISLMRTDWDMRRI